MDLNVKSVKDFVFELSSKSPTPGGGGASALAGALGIALGGMVANLTIGKPKYADKEDEMNALKVAAYRLQKELIDLIGKDADAFGPLAGAYRMPKGTEAERTSRARIMEASMKEASLVPLEMMKKCAESITLLEIFAEKGNILAVSDAACGAVLCKAAMQSAWLNVTANTVSIKDKDFAERVNAEGRRILDEYTPRADALYEKVEIGFKR
ncbi:MAG: cyclodeaminase/cyclohydrolase family protein [Clostridiales Family XIII bacterium]|nr:cyclodeaminase/cyclohydrolase family protein [Clostridiales Family XIII bacterium]